MRKLAFVLLLGSITQAMAADRALILDDQDQRDLITALDMATKAGGLAVAQTNLRLFGKLQAAGVVTEHKDAPLKDGGNAPK